MANTSFPSQFSPQILMSFVCLGFFHKEMGTETLRVCLKIVECHILLGPKEFLQVRICISKTNISQFIVNYEKPDVY